MTTDPRLISPLGDSREHPVACRDCHQPTWALNAVCDACFVNEADAPAPYTRSEIWLGEFACDPTPRQRAAHAWATAQHAGGQP